MPRIRSLKPEFFKHPRLGELPIAARYFYAGLWCQADREGRLKDRPKLLKLEIAPWDDLDANSMLEMLAAAGFIERYEIDGEGYIAIRHFTKHQRPHPKEPKSEIPPPQRPGPLRAVERNGETRPAVERNGAASKQDPAVEKNGEPGGFLSLGSGGSTGEKAGGRDLRDLEQPRPAVEKRGSEPDRAAVAKSPPPPPLASGPEKQKPLDAGGFLLAAYLRATWPRLETPEKVVPLWRERWPRLDLLAEAKAARGYELETGKGHDSPGSFLRSWFRRSATGATVSGGRAEAGANVPDPAETRRRLDERDRQFHEDRAVNGKTSEKRAESRAWLHKRWPEKHPLAEERNTPAESSAESHG